MHTPCRNGQTGRRAGLPPPGGKEGRRFRYKMNQEKPQNGSFLPSTGSRVRGRGRGPGLKEPLFRSIRKGSGGKKTRSVSCLAGQQGLFYVRRQEEGLPDAPAPVAPGRIDNSEIPGRIPAEKAMSQPHDAVQHDPCMAAQDRIQEPRLFRVLLHNDNYTTMEFVVMVLMNIFHKSPEDASDIMFSVHEKGVGVCGVYPREIAEFRVNLVIRRAREAGFPLMCTMEEDQP
jgi:ATP-dependent Clp protease adaptor protein ClpS